MKNRFYYFEPCGSGLFGQTAIVACFTDTIKTKRETITWWQGSENETKKKFKVIARRDIHVEMEFYCDHEIMLAFLRNMISE